MKVYEVYRAPGVDVSMIERFCTDVQILFNKLEEAQAAGVSLNGDCAKIALSLVDSRGFQVSINRPTDAEAALGFQITRGMRQEGVAFEALFLPRANSSVMFYLGRKFLDSKDRLKLLGACGSVDIKLWNKTVEEVKKAVSWLGGSVLTIGIDKISSISVKMDSWKHACEYARNDFSLLCFSLEEYIFKANTTWNNDSAEAKLWKRYFGLKARFETNTFLSGKCHQNCSLEYCGTFLAVAQTNSVPTQYFGCVDFRMKGWISWTGY